MSTIDYLSFSEMKELYNGNSAQVMIGKHNGKSYTLKRYKEDYAQDHKEKTERELLITKLAYPEVADEIQHLGHSYILRPFFEGVTLKKYLSEWQFENDQFLELVISLVAKIRDIHKLNVLHLDLNPRNIILNPASGEINIIDFGNSNLYRYKSVYLGNPERVECMLEYISPEQTGRINRMVDYGSDFYSLGVIMYEMAASQLPFITDNPLELVHSHIAKLPDNPTEYNSELSPQIAAIILKLLAKNTEDRYLSEEGLIMDLERCIKELEQSQSISSFPLGLADVNKQLHVSEKLVGRDSEASILQSAYNKAVNGEDQYVLISGGGGTGKSILVSQLHKNIINNGIYISGKFDQVNRNMPCSGWIQAFNNLIEIIITENLEKQNFWKNLMTEKLGSLLPYLGAFIPNLKWLFPEMETEKLNYTDDSQNRFHYALKSLLLCAADEQHPLIIFLDDWQWSDNSSVRVLNEAFKEEELKHLMVICAYRDQEVESGHSFNRSLELLNNSSVSKLHLDNLDTNNTLTILEDSLKQSGIEVNQLNAYIYDRTEGNPFFYKQILEALETEQLIKYEANKWNWDLDEIGKTIVTDNIVQLLIKKIGKYQKEEQNLLQLAACIGNKFDVDSLALITGMSRKECLANLKESLQEGLLTAKSSRAMEQGSKVFAHDRIQQGVYEMQSAEQKKSNHYKIAKQFLEYWKKSENEDFDTQGVFHLNAGYDLFLDNSDKKDIAIANLKASKKSMVLVDYENAMDYTIKALSILDDNSEISANELYQDALLTGFTISSRIEDKKQNLQFRNKLTDTDLTKVNEARFVKLKVDQNVNEGKFEEAIGIGIAYLAEQGVKIKRNLTKKDIVIQAIKTGMTYKKKNILALSDLPELTDPFKIELANIGLSTSSAAYFSNQDLWVLINMRFTAFFIKNGISPLASFNFLSYAAGLIIATKDIKSGIAFGKVSMAIFEKLNTKEYFNRSLFSLNTLIKWWESHVGETIDGLSKSLSLSKFKGDFEFVSYNTNIIASVYCVLGNDFNEAKQLLPQFEKDVALYNDKYNVSNIKVYCEYIRCLNDPLFNNSKLEGENYAVTDFLTDELNKDDKLFLYTHYGFQMRLNYLLGYHNEAYQDLLKKNEYGDSATHEGVYIHVVDCLFSAMLLMINYETVPNRDKSSILKEIKKLIKDFKKNHKLCPVNFENKYHLLLAMYQAFIDKDISKALKTFESAIHLSRKNNFILEEGISWEESGKLYKQLGQTALQMSQFQQAYKQYKKCGAEAVAARLLKSYPELNIGYSANDPKIEMTSSESGNALASLDVESILKSSEVLMGETDYHKLIRKLILIAIENAGAEKAYLILRVDKLKVVASGYLDESTEVYEDQALSGFDQLPETIIRFVDKTSKTFILDDDKSRTLFANDPYSEKSNSQSIFCLPIKNKGNHVGVLYLENSLTKDVFTSERVEMLKVLSSQMAVSIENTMLIENLEEKVKERTSEIKSEKESVDRLLKNILPKSTAEELKLTGKAQPKFYDEVSVMFLDFKNFSQHGKQLDYRDLVDLLDLYFKEFDKVTETYHIEKIKTIGDAYMCACGLPIERSDHALLLCRAAIEMQKIISDFKIERVKSNKPYFEARVGIHTGPVVAGVVGSKKFAYDIWGDTVNIAARIEGKCEIGDVAISKQTYSHVHEILKCDYKGKVEAKNMEMLDLYFVSEK